MATSDWEEVASQAYEAFDAGNLKEAATCFPHSSHEPWNKGKLVGQKAPLRLRDIWAIRIRLQLRNKKRDLALFNLAIDSKLRACDLVKLRVRDVAHGACIARRSIVLQQKTQRRVQFEITEQTRIAVSDWIARASLQSDSFLFRADCMTLCTCQRDNTPASSMAGSQPLVWTRLLMKRTRCDGRKPR